MKQNIIKLRKLSSCVFLAIILTLASSCDEDRVGQNPVDNVPPEGIKNVQIEALAGGAKIIYDLPNEVDISYVICEYMFKGETKVVRSSIYSNFIIVEGLPDIAPCKFTLYLIDHSENKSQPYTGLFTPLEPPHITISKTVTMEPDFGGVVIRWNNISNTLIGAFLYAMNDNGEWEETDLVFSTITEEKRSIRGYNTDERQFGVCIIDRFGNTSDTIVVTAIPLYEKQLDKKKFKDGHLLGDNITSSNARTIENIWDGTLDIIWHTSATASLTPPQYFTIDLGVNAQLSRMMLWNRQDGYNFSQHNVRFFEVWGTTELTHGINDSYWTGNNWKDNWVMLGDFEQIKPSGLPPGQNTDEDIAATNAGSEFIFELGVGEMRYLRFIVKETWGRTAALHIAEVSIFGDDGIREEE